MREPMRPERDAVEGAEAGKLEVRLRRAVEAGRTEDALDVLSEFEKRCAGSASQLVVTTYLLCVVRSAPLVAASSQADLIALARDVVAVVEPWFTRGIDDFAEVAEGGRHAALHSLMLVAADTGKFDQAVAIRNLDHAGNKRCVARWAKEGIASSPGCHAHYPNAYGSAQLIGHLAKAGRFDEVPALLDGLAAMTGMTAGVDAETLDALGEEEAGALDAVLACDAPAGLLARCQARRGEIADLAQPAKAWPRTRARLGSSSR